MSRAHVAAHQRARLRGAAVAALGEKGAATVTVADLIALAGVSRRAFYEHFDSKEACLLACYEDMLAGAARRVMAAYSSEQDPLAGIGSAYEAFVDELLENPVAARVAFVDVLALGRGAIERAEPLRLAFEAKIREDDSLRAGVSFDPVVLTAVLAGAWQIARRRLLEDRVQELRGLRRELLAWVACYSSPAVEHLCLRAPEPVELPVPAKISCEDDPHTRLLRATIRLAASDGYRMLSPARIIDAANVSYETFFERFQTVEECFLAALELMAAEALAHAWRAARTGEDWVDATQLAIRAFFWHVAHEPSFTQLAFIEIFAMGNTGLLLRERLLRRVERLYMRHANGPQRPSRLIAEAVVGALWGLLYDKSLRGEPDRLSDLSEHAAYITLTPILGADQAIQRITTTHLTPTPRTTITRPRRRTVP